MKVLSALRRSLRLLWPRPAPPVPQEVFQPGCPAALSPEALNQVCEEHFHSPYHRVCYTHLSGWKASGAYRLFLTLASGAQITLIFKNAVYDPHQTPALAGLPLHPGPPEWAILRSTYPPLARWTAAVYLAQAVAPPAHYQYLLADLAPHYRPLRPDRRLLPIVELLPAIHQTLAGWLAAGQPERLLDFGPAFQNRLFDYARAGLLAYHNRFHAPRIAQALSALAPLEERYQRHLRRSAPPLTAIHGDLNYANILLHPQDPQDAKLLDWEWAGLGQPHADLAALLKGTNPALERRAFRRYASANPHLSLAEHRRLYLWCKIERGLLDAGFLAAQAALTGHETRFNLHAAVSAALNRVHSAQRELSEDG